MFKTIVLALDGSEGSEQAIPFAAALAREEQARIVIAHVDERIVAKGDLPHVHPNEDEIRAEIKQEAEKLSEQGIEASVKTTEIAVGGPAHSIAEIADQEDADLIVLGTRGHSSVAGLLLGGVTHRLLHIAKRPVLAVPQVKA